MTWMYSLWLEIRTAEPFICRVGRRCSRRSSCRSSSLTSWYEGNRITMLRSRGRFVHEQHVSIANSQSGIDRPESPPAETGRSRPLSLGWGTRDANREREEFPVAPPRTLKIIKIPVWWRRAVLPSLSCLGSFLFFFRPCVSCELVCVCVSLVRVVIICPASTHTALVSSPSLAVLHLST